MGLLPRLSAAGVQTLAEMLAVQEPARRRSRPRPGVVRAVRGVIRAV